MHFAKITRATKKNFLAVGERISYEPKAGKRKAQAGEALHQGRQPGGEQNDQRDVRRRLEAEPVSLLSRTFDSREFPNSWFLFSDSRSPQAINPIRVCPDLSNSASDYHSFSRDGRLVVAAK